MDDLLDDALDFDAIDDILTPRADPFADIAGVASPNPILLWRPRSELPRRYNVFHREPGIVETFAALPDLPTLSHAALITRGRMLMTEVLDLILRQTGPADVLISTWCMSPDNTIALRQMQAAGLIRSARILLDPTMPRRDTQAFDDLARLFGRSNLRLAHNHAKFLAARGATRTITMLGSANFDSNPRSEWAVITEDPALESWLESFAAQIFAPIDPLQEQDAPIDLDDLDQGLSPAEAYLIRGERMTRAYLSHVPKLRNLEYLAVLGTARMHPLWILHWILRSTVREAPADLTISIWRMHRTIAEALDLLRDRGLICSMRLVIDRSCAKREPESWPTVERIFRPENIRVIHNHAKLFTLSAGTRRITGLMSANWNATPRPELTWIRECPDLFAMAHAFSEKLFSTPPRR